MSDAQLHVFTELLNAYVRSELLYSDIKLSSPTPNPHNSRALSFADKTRNSCRTQLFKFVTTLV